MFPSFLRPEVFPSSIELVRAADVDKPFRLRLEFASGTVHVWAFATVIARDVAHAGLAGLPVVVVVLS